MSDTTRNDMKIAGTGTVSGGTYGDITIAGMGTVTADVECVRFHVGGTATVNGNLKADSIQIGGTSYFKGDVDARESGFGGVVDVDGKVTGGSLNVAGSTTIQEGVSVERFEVRGTAEVRGDVEAETFEGHGVFTVTGLLNAGTVTVRLYGKCSVREMGGDSIDVRQGRPWPFAPIWGERSLTCDSIEGDTVYLENTIAKVVRGAHVEIGPSCDIELVEYTGSLKVANGVRSSRKVEAGA